MGSTSKRDLIADFQEQWRFLHLLMRAYDEGDGSVAKLIAVQIRKFVYDTSASKSLLMQMGLKDKLHFLSSGSGVSPYNVAGTTSLCGMEFTSSPEWSGIRYVPLSPYQMVEAIDNNDLSFARVPLFNEWWTEPVVKDTASQIFSRSDLVLMLANRDGGAHIDNLKPHEAALKGGLNYGWSVELGHDTVLGPDEVVFNPTNASVRSIATELDLSFQGQSEVLGFEFDGEIYKPAPETYGEDEAVVVHYGIEVRHYDDEGGEIVQEPAI